MDAIVLIIILSIGLIALLAMCLNMYFVDRTDEVIEFQLNLLTIIEITARELAEQNKDASYLQDLFDKHSFYRLLYSFKPLTISAWYTEEEIKLLKGE